FTVSKSVRETREETNIKLSSSFLEMGIVWVFSDTSAQTILLKRYRCLNGAGTDTFFFLSAKRRLTTLKERLFFIAKAFFFLQIEQYLNCLKYTININTYKTLGFQLQLKTF